MVVFSCYEQSRNGQALLLFICFVLLFVFVLFFQNVSSHSQTTVERFKLQASLTNTPTTSNVFGTFKLNLAVLFYFPSTCLNWKVTKENVLIL